MKLSEKTIGLILSFVLLFVISICLAVGDARRAVAEQENSITDCYCETNIYDCNDFKTRQEARGVYECCLKMAGKDVHKLDNDKDGIICEWK